MTGQNVPALGIDFGSARIGIAVSDQLGILAQPLETIAGDQHPQAAARIVSLTAAHGARTVVIGLPLRMDGGEGTAAQRVRTFAAALRTLLPDSVALAFVDERLSTVEAQEHLRRAGKLVRENKALIDQAAATIILQDWLDQQQDPQALLLPDPDAR